MVSGYRCAVEQGAISAGRGKTVQPEFAARAPQRASTWIYSMSSDRESLSRKHCSSIPYRPVDRSQFVVVIDFVRRLLCDGEETERLVDKGNECRK
jgi:hypothetical protein